jgi:sialate O-acetylesterase
MTARNRIKMVLTLSVAAMLFSSLAVGAAEKQPLELASPFVDNLILQREMKVPVWGWAAPGAGVTVNFGGQSKTATADEKGKWMVNLDPLTASAEERELTVRTAAGEKLTCKGVLVGEVWLASGQSNMDWVAGKSMCASLVKTLQQSKDEIPIREYAVDIGSALFPQSRTASAEGWKKAEKAGDFSALALSFSWSLYEELKVPIGILHSSHGATQVETWTAYEGFASHPKLQDIAAKIRQSDPTTAEGKAAYAKFYDDLGKWQVESEKLIKRGGAVLRRPELPGIGAEWRGPTRLYNKKIAPLIPYAIRGAIWCQGESNSDDGRIYAAKMEALVNGWRMNWGRPDLPFYFTQMQCYGAPNPDDVGFADIREAQRLFFMNAKNVGMVLQHDLNPANPGGIHYTNKLDPGNRLARWALAHEYGKEIAYTGPIYKSHSIQGNTVRVQFEQRGPGGGLMVGSKGEEGKPSFVEPAVETKGASLKHFRLAGKDRVWHDAEAVIDGEEVVVTSKEVPNPVGVEYAYCASPIGANLSNRAGLPATPFAYFDGKQLFKEDDLALVAAEKAEAERKWGKKTYLLPASLFRDHGVIQRDLPVPVWGHGVPGTEITVAFGGQSKKTKVDEFEKWLVRLDPMPASNKGSDLTISSSDGAKISIQDIVVGDVWFLTGATSLSSELLISGSNKAASPPAAMPLLREFRIKTKTRRFPTPRKLRFEIGGGKYVSSWQPATLAAPNAETSVAAYYFASQIQQANVPIGIITLGANSPPLTWISYEGMQSAAGFEKERDELNLLYPDTDICKAAVTKYIETVKQYNRDIVALRAAGEELPKELAEKAPGFPQPYYNEWAERTVTATHAYNFCISPLTPCAVRGVVWIPDKDNISDDVSKYGPALSTYAKSLAKTYGQDKVLFVYAQPAAQLVERVAEPKIDNSMSVEFDQWPKSLQEIATRLGALAAGAGSK